MFMNTLEKNLKFSILFEIYGKLLTKKQQEIFSLYYDEDLSLSEIAENCNITRQAVLDSIRKSEKNLIDFENKLEIISKKERIQGLINKINSQSDKNQLLITIESIKKLL
ncbi:MAG: DNA-binding protein [Clostridiales bacterium]|nr:DNA-binding protein [Clostridiales bacterium]